MTIIELKLSTAIKEAGDIEDVRLMKEDAEYILELLKKADDALNLLKEQKKPDCEHAEHDGIGCLGYAGCTQEDEPIEVCKECEKYTGNVFEAMKLNDKC